MSLSNSKGSVNTVKREFSEENSNSGAEGGHGTGGESSIPIHL